MNSGAVEMLCFGRIDDRTVVLPVRFKWLQLTAELPATVFHYCVPLLCSITFFLSSWLECSHGQNTAAGHYSTDTTALQHRHYSTCTTAQTLQHRHYSTGTTAQTAQALQHRHYSTDTTVHTGLWKTV